MVKATIVTLGIILSLVFPGLSSAQAPDCLPIYGGGETCLPPTKIKVDKKITRPSTEKFVDNLSASDPKYKAGDAISFQLLVTNVGEETLSKIEITDNLPRFIIYTSGPGTFDEKTRTIKFTLDALKKNETRKFIVKGIVNDIPNSTCVVNYVRVKSGGVSAEDSSKFCLEKSICEDNGPGATTKGGFPVMPPPKVISQTPSTGPEMIPLISLIPIGLAGFYLRKRSTK